MTSELQPLNIEQQADPTFADRVHDSITSLRTKFGRAAVVGLLTVSSTFAAFAAEEVVHPEIAYADTLSYPDASMPCEHSPYSVSGSCANYDWGPTHTEAYNDSSEISSRGYAYRNCTDYVAWKEGTLGVSVPHTLGNGGDWYSNAPSSERSSTPKAWDAAVVPATYNSQGVETSYGHVAFIESVNSVDANNPLNDNITVSEYNHDAMGNGDTRTGTASSMGFTEFVDFGLHPADGGSGGSGCTITNSNGNLVCDGSLTGVGVSAGSGQLSGNSLSINNLQRGVGYDNRQHEAEQGGGGTRQRGRAMRGGP